jgi:hypothetical protein
MYGVRTSVIQLLYVATVIVSKVNSKRAKFEGVIGRQF